MRTISLTIAAVLLCLTISGHAEAHARLKAAIPAVGAIVSDAPQQLRLTFSEPVEAGAVVVDVGTSEGMPVGPTRITADPVDPRTIIVTLPTPLPPGTYTVQWSVRSEDDARVKGGYSFQVSR